MARLSRLDCVISLSGQAERRIGWGWQSRCCAERWLQNAQVWFMLREAIRIVAAGFVRVAVSD
jgi:hypothetical protein